MERSARAQRALGELEHDDEGGIGGGRLEATHEPPIEKDEDFLKQRSVSTPASSFRPQRSKSERGMGS